MIRKDREITDRKEQLAIMAACDVCRIALNDPESGFPYIVPLNFGVDVQGDEVYLYFHSARIGRKLELIAEEFPYNPKTIPATRVWRLKVTDMTGKMRDNVHPGESRWTPPTSSVAAQGHEA